MPQTVCTYRWKITCTPRRRLGRSSFNKKRVTNRFPVQQHAKPFHQFRWPVREVGAAPAPPGTAVSHTPGGICANAGNKPSRRFYKTGTMDPGYQNNNLPIQKTERQVFGVKNHEPNRAEYVLSRLLPGYFRDS